MENINIEIFNEAVLRREATWWQMELPSGKVFFGDAKTEMLGFPSSDFSVYQDFTNLLHEEDKEKAGKTDPKKVEKRVEYISTNDMPQGQVAGAMSIALPNVTDPLYKQWLGQMNNPDDQKSEN